MPDDAELLRRYAEERSEDAFAALVRRHLNLVYFAALRQVGGDTHSAEDVAQSVFTDLARKAASLSRREVVASWLYTSTRFAAAKTRRAAARRLKHETEAETMRALNGESASAAEWEQLRPLVDDVVHELGKRDRGVVVLRYFEGRPFAEIGAAYAITEDAARMRVERALEKLRALLARRGVTSSAAALAATLESQAMLAAPAGLASAVTSAALSGGVASAMGVFMSVAKLQIALGAVAAVSAGMFVYQANANAALRREIAIGHGGRQTVARLSAENRQLAQIATEVAQLRRDDAELARLRDEAAALRRRMADRTVAPRATARSVPPAFAATESVTLNLPDADVRTVLAAYQQISGQRVIRDPAVDRVPTTIPLHSASRAREEALVLIRNALRDRAHIVLEPAADGTVRAWLVR